MSSLRESVQDYLAMRRQLGFKLRDAGAGLLDFVSFLEQRHAAYITTHVALKWAQRPRSVQPAEWARRLGFVRSFARYRNAIDPRTQIPPCGLLPYRPKRAQPYLYTEQEIESLLAAALNLPPPEGLRRWTYHCLFGLLSVSGLRISEALNLKVDDVDVVEGLLTIHGTKFGQSRLVAIHASTQRVLLDYLRRRQRFLAGRPASHVFVSTQGNRLDGGDVHRTFYSLSRQVGLRGPLDSHGPRIHDLRHRFALETLLQWYRSGQDVERRLPVLSTYLGHVHVNDTYWYLNACPELMGLAVKRLEQRWEEAS